MGERILFVSGPNGVGIRSDRGQLIDQIVGLFTDPLSGGFLRKGFNRCNEESMLFSTPLANRSSGRSVSLQGKPHRQHRIGGSPLPEYGFLTSALIFRTIRSALVFIAVPFRTVCCTPFCLN